MSREDRCPTCDRPQERGGCEVRVSFESKGKDGWNLQARRDCEAHRVDWRARALKLEEHSDRPAEVDLSSPDDMLRLASLYSHDLARPSSTNGELALAACVEALHTRLRALEGLIEYAYNASRRT